MAKKKNGGGGKSKQIPLAIVLPAGIVVLSDIQQGGTPAGIANRIVEDVTGYNVLGKSFDYEQALPFWLGEIAGIVIHKVAQKTGVNRHLGKLTMGYIGL